MSKFLEYEQNYDYRIMSKVPVMVKCSIRNFDRLTRKLDKPFCKEFIDITSNAMFNAIKEIEGALFGYHYAGEFIFVLRNDVNKSAGVFYNNKIQKISSVISSLMTNSFIKFYLAADTQPDIVGDAVFDVLVFGVPSVTESVNYVLAKQQESINLALNEIIKNELRMSKDHLEVVLTNEGLGSKLKLLTENGVDINNHPSYCISGVCSYKVPKVAIVNNIQVTKKKWHLDLNQDLGKDKTFLTNIIKSGHDVFRT